MGGLRILTILVAWAGASAALADAVPVAPTYVGLWERTPTRADIARVFPDSALNMHIKVLVRCTLDADRRAADCRPHVMAGPIGDAEKAAAQMASLWEGPMGEWASLPAGAPIWISIDFEPHSARLTRTMSSTGMPSVMQTMSGISAWIASAMASAAPAGGT